MQPRPSGGPPWKVTETCALLPYLFRRLAHLKKTKVRQTLKFGSVVVNGRVITLHSYALKPGDTVNILDKRSAFTKRLETRLPFPILHEDDALVVVEKPPGLLSMATETEKERTLYAYLTAYERTKSDRGQGRVFIVHRLDREASGLIVFAKTEAAKKALQKNWPKTVKRYAAVTEGVPKLKEGVLRSQLLEEDKSRRVHSAARPTQRSRQAVTRYRVLGENGRNALLEITLETGRKNQIRVHLAEIGHPIVGDKKYGARTDVFGRLALHAVFLSFPHPATGKFLSFSSAQPKEFADICRSRV